jgi:ubiquinone biosynthesis protein Coq4
VGLLVIVAGGYARFGQVSRELAPAARRTVRQAFMRGLRASPLLHLDYVEALGRDVGALREELGLGSPPVYHPVRAHEVDMSF